MLQTPRRAVGAALAVLLVTISAVEVTAAGSAGAATGPDVASWQHPNGAPIDWNQVRAAGHDFAFVKADEGPVANGRSYYTNPYFTQDWNGAAAVGLYRGAYHFARPKLPLSTAIDDARHFVSVTGTMQGSRDLPPVLDIEVTGGLAPGDVAQWSRLWLQEVERLTGRVPIIYTGYYFWRDSVGAPTDFGRYPLWLAAWTNAAAPTLIPSSWSTWTFWQWTATGSSPGIPHTVDLNRFCCPDGNLSLLTGRGNVAFSNPFGAVDGAVRRPNEIEISGWTIDPDTTASIPVHVYIDGQIAGDTLAGRARSDVAGAYPGFGAAHGFSFTAKVGPGTHTVCAYAINAGAGSANSSLGCRTLVSDPFGSFDTALRRPGGAVRVEGWGFDPDTSGAVQIDVRVNGLAWASGRADRSRPDLATALGLASTDHGFSIDVAGLSTVVDLCLSVRNVGPGRDRDLGCRRIDARREPVGSFDIAAVGETALRVAGWALDPDTAGSIPVHVYVDGRFVTAATAASSRPDVGAVYPGFGPAHGFEVDLAGTGIAEHEVCVYAINVGIGQANPFLGCKRVTPAGEPFGSLDVVARAGGGVRVAGWAIDPSVGGASRVRVEIDGVPATFVANAARPDVGAAYPRFGASHGFDRVVAATAGSRQVCVWALNEGQGLDDRALGCRRITV